MEKHNIEQLINLKERFNWSDDDFCKIIDYLESNTTEITEDFLYHISNAIGNYYNVEYLLKSYDKYIGAYKRNVEVARYFIHNVKYSIENPSTRELFEDIALYVPNCCNSIINESIINLINKGLYSYEHSRWRIIPLLKQYSAFDSLDENIAIVMDKEEESENLINYKLASIYINIKTKVLESFPDIKDNHAIFNLIRDILSIKGINDILKLNEEVSFDNFLSFLIDVINFNIFNKNTLRILSNKNVYKNRSYEEIISMISILNKCKESERLHTLVTNLLLNEKALSKLNFSSHMFVVNEFVKNPETQHFDKLNRAINSFEKDEPLLLEYFEYIKNYIIVGSILKNADSHQKHFEDISNSLANYMDPSMNIETITKSLAKIFNTYI